MHRAPSLVAARGRAWSGASDERVRSSLRVMHPPPVRAVSAALLALGAAAASPRCADAQSLHGSRASVNRMYRHARSERLPFYETARGVRAAAARGSLVRLAPGPYLALGDVSFPLVQRTTRTFVQRLAEEYHDACGERLVVTSAVRPTSRQPENSVERSVHPTGMAVDLRKPKGACLRWLRATLLDLEDAGLIEATEEFHPPHFHVAVYPTPYRRYVAARQHDDTVADDAQ